MQVAIGEHFTGNALGVVDAKSRASLPAPFRLAVERRANRAIATGTPSLDRVMYLDEHPDLPCVQGYDPVHQDSFVQKLEASIALRVEDPLTAFGKAQSDLFGNSTEVGYDPAGRFVMPGSLRKYAAIELNGVALFWGAGETFEIWNPDRFRAAYHDDGKRMRKLDELLEARAARA